MDQGGEEVFLEGERAPLSMEYSNGSSRGVLEYPFLFLCPWGIPMVVPAEISAAVHSVIGRLWCKDSK